MEWQKSRDHSQLTLSNLVIPTTFRNLPTGTFATTPNQLPPCLVLTILGTFAKPSQVFDHFWLPPFLRPSSKPPNFSTTFGSHHSQLPKTLGTLSIPSIPMTFLKPSQLPNYYSWLSPLPKILMICTILDTFSRPSQLHIHTITFDFHHSQLLRTLGTLLIHTIPGALSSPSQHTDQFWL